MIDSTEAVPLQIVFKDALADDAATEGVFTIIDSALQDVILQVPSALTQYVVVLDGATTIDEPVPNKVPPHDEVNHFQIAPVPRLPPLTVRVTLVPLQIVVAEAVIPLAGNDVSSTFIVLLMQAVELQVPSALR